jgi:hypothetical protein
MATVSLRLKRVLNEVHNHVQNIVLPLEIQPASEIPSPYDMPATLAGGHVGGLAITRNLSN